jgi:hypothetical protein
MNALDFWKEITVDKANFLEQFISLLNTHAIRFCVIGGQAVNAYVEPLVSLDLDVVVATDQVDAVMALLRERFVVKAFPHSLNIELAGSDLRVQIQNDLRYSDFVARAEMRNVLGLALPVAALEDVMRGKVWAAQDPGRRGSKRQKDFADIARLVEAYPDLRELVPDDILRRIE